MRKKSTCTSPEAINNVVYSKTRMKASMTRVIMSGKIHGSRQNWTDS